MGSGKEIDGNSQIQVGIYHPGAAVYKVWMRSESGKYTFYMKNTPKMAYRGTSPARKHPTP